MSESELSNFETEMDLATLQGKLEVFAAERDWDQFHTPKNLSMALVVETAELLEHFQWLTDEQSQQLPPEKLEKVYDEIGDVMIYLARLSSKLGIDPVKAAFAKIEKNAIKYPSDKVRGSAKKYDEYTE